MIPAPTSSDQPHLLRLPNWLGDFILSVPSVRHYQSWLGNQAPLVVVGPPSMRALAPILLPGIEYIPAPAFPLALHPLLRKRKVSVAVALPNSLRVALEILPVPYRAGFERGFRNSFLTEHRIRRTSPFGYVHVADQYLGLLEDLGLPKGQATLPTPPQLSKPPNAPDHPYLAVLPGAAYGPAPPNAPDHPYLAVLPGAAYGPAKRWDPASFASVVSDLQQSHSLEPILMGGSDDQKDCQAVAEALGSPITNLAGKTTTLELAEWLAHAHLVLCHDSGPMHLAAYLRKPAVAVFGSTEPAWTGPLGDSVTVVRHKVSCSPCFLRVCPLDRRCMTRLTPEEVLTACRHRLAQK
ncbi:MAG: lipopolysaccharide heptosyltransferase II [Verrucomicrobia bacterium]|nr:lipopolysaccharide heptosyltransferase II [Verrucomicrobiota bacterium]